MAEDSDSYVAQLKEVFVSCDTTGSGCLNASELLRLCKKLHLVDQTDVLVTELLQKSDADEVKFDEFKNSFIALLSSSSTSEEKESIEGSSFQEQGADREVSPKFILGRKKYGRRSRPSSLAEGDDQISLPSSNPDSCESSSASCSSHKSNQKPECVSGKRPVSPSYPQQPPTKSGRMTDLMTDEKDIVTGHQCQSSNSECDMNSFSENNLVDYLQQTWKKLEIGSDGFLTVEELSLVCEDIGMDMTDEGISQLFEKLDCDQDGRISFDEFVQGLFEHGEPQSHSTGSSPAKPSQQLFNESSRDEQISTSSISGIFSCLDNESKGYAEGSNIVDLWELLEVPCPSQMLEDLGYTPSRKVNLSDLSNVLEEEIVSSLRTPTAQLAFISYQNEFNYLRQCNEQMRTERNKLKESVEEANARAVLLAQEVDDNHAKLEIALHEKLLLAEKKYHEQVRQLVEDLQQERETIAHQTNKLKQELQSEIQRIREEETQLKSRLQVLEQENARLEMELQEATERWSESEKQKEILQEEMSGVSSLKQRLEDLESRHSEIQEHQHQSLLLEIENYKRVNQELQDKIDELTLEIENLQHHSSPMDSGGTVSRSQSWLSDYKKAAAVGFKRRGSDSSSEDNSDDECPSIGKMRKTFPKNENLEDRSLEEEIVEDRFSSACETKTCIKSKHGHPTSIDTLLRNMFVDKEHLAIQLSDMEKLKQEAAVTNIHLHNECRLLSTIAYDANKTAVA